MEFGATECLNPKDFDKPIQQASAVRLLGCLERALQGRGERGGAARRLASLLRRARGQGVHS